MSNQNNGSGANQDGAGLAPERGMGVAVRREAGQGAGHAGGGCYTVGQVVTEMLGLVVNTARGTTPPAVALGAAVAANAVVNLATHADAIEEVQVRTVAAAERRRREQIAHHKEELRRLEEGV